MKTIVRSSVICAMLTAACLHLGAQQAPQPPYVPQPWETPVPSHAMPLWTTPPAESNGLSGPDTIGNRGFTYRISVPSVTIYRPDPAKNTGIAVLITPGGGYGAVALNREGDPFGHWLAENGITGVVLKYRLPNGHRNIPLADAKQAMRLIGRHSAEWGVDTTKVGVMGFSAGGHLASTLLTHYDPDNRPAFGVLFYPVITFDDRWAHRGSVRNLLGDNPTEQMRDYYSSEKQVTPRTPPTLIFHCADDKTVDPENAVMFYEALRRNGVLSAFYMFPAGSHGWGYRPNFAYHEVVKELILRWIWQLYPQPQGAK